MVLESRRRATVSATPEENNNAWFLNFTSIITKTSSDLVQMKIGQIAAQQNGFMCHF